MPEMQVRVLEYAEEGESIGSKLFFKGKGKKRKELIFDSTPDGWECKKCKTFCKDERECWKHFNETYPELVSV